MKYSLWFVGMFVLLYVVLRVETWVNQITTASLFETPEIWIVSLISVALGAYLSLLFISGKPHFNTPLLVCVFIPSTLLGFYFPVAIIFGLHIPLWLPQFDRHGLFHIASGLSLVMGLLNGKR